MDAVKNECRQHHLMSQMSFNWLPKFVTNNWLKCLVPPPGMTVDTPHPGVRWRLPLPLPTCPPPRATLPQELSQVAAWAIRPPHVLLETRPCPGPLRLNAERTDGCEDGPNAKRQQPQ